MEVGFRREEGQEGQRQAAQGRRQAEQGQGQAAAGQEPTQGTHGEGPGGTQRRGSSPLANFQGYCGKCGKWGHPQRECWAKSINNLADKHLGEQQLEGGTPTNSSGDHDTGAGQGGFAGGILGAWTRTTTTTRGGSSQFGGAGWPSGFQGRPGQWCTILIDSGSSATVWPAALPGLPDCAERASRALRAVGQNR